MSLETVLLAVGEGDERRVDKLVGTTADIAGPADATIELGHVFSKAEYDRARDNLQVDDDAEITPASIAKRHVVVRQIGTALRDRGLMYDVHGRYSDSESRGGQIVALADTVDADLLIVGGRTRSPTGKAVFGSTAQEVMLHAPCPVTFVRTDE